MNKKISTSIKHLIDRKRALPNWLARHAVGLKPNIEEIFSERTVYYPGSGTDGQPVELFASTHFSHTFLYVEYGIERPQIKNELRDNHHGFKGYNLLDEINISPEELTHKEWANHLNQDKLSKFSHSFSQIKPYAFIQVLERKSEYTDTHGPTRLAIIFIGGDGIELYDAIYCKGARKPPIAIIIQDHGFGGGHARFDKDSPLHKIAARTRQFPEYLLVAEYSKEWPNYTPIDDKEYFRGGMHGTPSRLFKKIG
jgi:hypothetical protein